MKMITGIFDRSQQRSAYWEYLREQASYYVRSTSGLLDSLFGDVVSLAKDYHCSREMRSEGQITPDYLQRKFITTIQKRLNGSPSFRPMQAALFSREGYTETNDGDLQDMLVLAQSDWNDVNTIKALYKGYGEIQWPRWDKERRKAWDLEKLFEQQN